MKKVFVLAVAAVFLMAGNVMALSLYDVLLKTEAPVYGGTVIDVTSLSTTVQDELKAITDSGFELFSFADFMVYPDDTSGFLFAEFTSGVNTQTMGIYKLGDTSKKLQIFSGADTAGQTSLVAISENGGGYDIESIYGSVADFGLDFGMYATTGGTTYYSESSLNPALKNAFVSFDIRTASFAVQNLFDSSNIIFGFEDGTDADYQDMVGGLDDVNPVPEPSTVLLLGAGILGVAAIARKRLNK